MGIRSYLSHQSHSYYYCWAALIRTNLLCYLTHRTKWVPARNSSRDMINRLYFDLYTYMYGSIYVRIAILIYIYLSAIIFRFNFQKFYCGNLCIAILISLFIHISIIFILILYVIYVALYICIPGTGFWTYVSAVHRCLLTPCPAATYHGICPLLPNDVVSMVTTCSQSMCTIVFGIGMYMTIHFKIFINSLLYQICCKMKKRSIYIYIYMCVCVCIVVL